MIESRKNVVVVAAVIAAAIAGFFAFRQAQPTLVPEVPAGSTETAQAVAPPPTFTPPALPIPVIAARQPDGAAASSSALCTACEEKHRGETGCNADMGCEGLAGEDKGLCEQLLSCMRAHPDCWSSNPNKCYCGTTRGTDCAKTPDGPCATEAIAAAKTDSALTAGLRFFKTEFPSGRATQQIVCSMTKCKTLCRAGIQ